MSTKIDINQGADKKDVTDAKIKAVQQKTQEVSDIVRQNVDKLIENGERLEDVEQKSLELEAESERMKKRSVSRKMCWDKYKTQCLLTTLFLTVLGMSILFFALSHK